jgi:hypothetical protein
LDEDAVVESSMTEVNRILDGRVCPDDRLLLRNVREEQLLQCNCSEKREQIPSVQDFLLSGKEHYLIINSPHDTEEALPRRMKLDRISDMINSLLLVGVDGRMTGGRFLKYAEVSIARYSEFKVTYTESDLKILSIVVLRDEDRVNLFRNH